MSALAPKADKQFDASECPLSAKSGHMHRSKKHRYSITPSARRSTDGGMVRSSDFAVLKFTTNSRT